MKTIVVAALAIVALGGCVAVPAYYPEPAGYYYGPPATMHFQYNYRGGHRHYHHRHYRHY